MELNPGYELTEIGPLPEEWQVLPMGLIGFFSRGHGINKDEATRGDLPCIRYGEIYTHHKDIIRNYYSNITEEVARTSKKLKKGDVLFTASGETKGEIGKSVAFTKDDEVYVGGDVIILTPHTGNSTFFGYLFNFPTIAIQKAEKGQGDTVVHIGVSALSSITVPLPPLNEQEAIAQALSDVDSLIESFEYFITKKRQIKLGAMQELLTGRKRLPGFSKNWETKSLGQVLTICHGKNQQSIADSSGDFPILASGGQIGLANRFLYNKTSVLIGRKGTIDEPQFMDTPFWCVDTLFYSEIHKPNVGKFLFYKFCLINWRQYNEASGVPSLNAKTIESIEIDIPEYSEQAAIVDVLSEIDLEITNLENKLAKVCHLKQGIMQELMTGRIRLVQPAANAIPLRVPGKGEVKLRGHNSAINEAVIISVLAKNFGSEQWPLGRKRYTKLSYLLHRHEEKQVRGYLKKAAGPYNPATKYKGAEKIALTNRYVRSHARDNFSGFIAAEKIAEAEVYFSKWYGENVIEWLKQFRYKKNDELELLATVDMAMTSLQETNTPVDLASVKRYIYDTPEWIEKLNRATFSDDNIDMAIKWARQLFES